MRTTITLTKENEKYIKSIKGYGESMSSAINKAINYNKIHDEQNKKYEILIQKIDNLTSVNRQKNN